MQDEDQQPGPEALYKKLYEAVDRMLEPHGKKLPGQRGIVPRHLLGPPFDVSKPNQHDSKSEFQLEYDVVSNGLSGIDQVFHSLFREPKDQPSIDFLNSLISDIDSKFRSITQPEDLKNSYHLIRSNAANVGGFITCLYLFRDFQTALRERLQELEDQKDQFWNVPHRAPDYYARFIALRLAKLFTRETGKFPTTGTSGETGEPSTSYTRALREVFDLLDISVGVRLPAEWALKQLSDDDLRPPNPFADNFGSSPFAGADDTPSRGLFSGIFSDPPDEKS